MTALAIAMTWGLVILVSLICYRIGYTFGHDAGIDHEREWVRAIYQRDHSALMAARQADVAASVAASTEDLMLRAGYVRDGSVWRRPTILGGGDENG